MNADDERTLARMERDLSHDARLENLGPALMAGSVLFGILAWVLFIAWAFLTRAGVL